MIGPSLIGPSLIGWALETFVATTLLMLVVLAIRAPVRKAFGPGMAYALWLLPLLRFALPPLPASWHQQATAPVAAVGDAITWYVIDATGGAPAAAAAAPVAPVDWLLVIAAVWALGAAAFLGFHLIAHGRFCGRLLRRARIDRTVAEGRVRVIETDAAHGPLAFGIWRKYVAFPRDFSERYDEVERDLALAHELGHHVRGDLIANWVALVVLALHWFNPVAWRAFRAFRADQEMACDALVLAGRHQALRHAYGRAIVKSAHGGAVSAACHLHTINELKGRLRMLSKTRKHSPIRIAAGAAGVTALSLAALGFTASGSQAAEGIKHKVEAATGIDLSGQDVPPPPPAPAVPPVAGAPAAPDAPPAPDAPRIEKRVYRVTTGEPGQDGKRVVVLRTGQDGADAGDLPDMKALGAEIPDISSGSCKDRGDDKQMVIVTPKAGEHKQRIVICVDRIMAQADAAKAFAVSQKRLGIQSALAGLHIARASIEAQTELTAEQKADALKGIDAALAEVEKEAAKGD